MQAPMILVVALALLLGISFLLSPRVRSLEGFFGGRDEAGAPPSLLTLTLSQVTTWIFARSLMNAAILGFYYGISGALAYAAYYLSFLTGGLIVDRIRFRHGQASIQDFLRDHYGRLGTATYNLVIAVRLMSEVFANLLVIGIIFGEAGTRNYTIAIVALAVLTLGYSMMGGLRASLRTDVLQTAVLYVGLAFLLGITVLAPDFRVAELIGSSPLADGPGWVLLVVALLQIWSYPMHDPVMMDRGFLTDRRTTALSFIHAAWISIAGIMVFGLLGTYAGLSKIEGEAMVAALTRLLGDPTMMVFNLALIVSAVSTLDSTFSSASKLVVADMGLMARTVRNGRIAMAVFLVGGLVFLFLGSKDLFAATAVSGTASMFLAPVIVFNVLGGRRISGWAYGFAFALALAGAALYMVESSGYLSLIEPLTGLAHKYSKLLVICGGVLAGGFAAFALDQSVRFRAARPAKA